MLAIAKNKFLEKALLIALVIALQIPAAAKGEEVKVLTSIAPLRSLAANVMKGTGATPEALITGAVSPHDYALKPSDAQKIKDADIIFLLSPEFETFMAKPAMQEQNKGKVVFLAETEGLKLLPAENNPELTDLHIWLDTENAAKMVQKMALTLAGKDWKNAPVYIKNANETMGRLRNLSASTAKLLENVKTVPFLVYHNAWQYFVKQNGLTAAGTVLPDEDSFPGIKQKLYLKNLVAERGIKCLFVDPWLNDDKAAKLAADLGVVIKEADPLGANIKGGTPATYYFTMMKDAAAAYKDCLEN